MREKLMLEIRHKRKKCKKKKKEGLKRMNKNSAK